MSLEEAFRTALSRNPSLAAIRPSEGVSQAALEAARAYPHNPQLTVDVRPFTRESTGKHDEVFFSASLLQEIELARQGRHRRMEGEAELDRARFLILDEESRVEAETGRRFFSALYRRELRDLAESQARLEEELLGVVERRFQAGLSAASDLALARIEARSARQQVDLARTREEVALQDLRKELGLTGSEAVRPAGALDGWSWPAPASTGAGPGGEEKVLLLRCLEELAAERPDVQAAGADLKARSARSDLASASRVPNISVGPVYEKDEAGTNFLGVETQIPLPIFSTGGPVLRQRQAEVRQGQEALEQLRAKARMEARTALSRYEEAFRLAGRFQRDLKEGFEPELQRVRDLYDAGLTIILEVYAAQANLQRARGNLLDARYELALAAVDLMAASALPPEALLTRKPREGR